MIFTENKENQSADYDLLNHTHVSAIDVNSSLTVRLGCSTYYRAQLKTTTAPYRQSFIINLKECGR